MTVVDRLRFAVVGPGRAGGSMLAALESAGARCAAKVGRNDDPSTLDPSVDLVVLGVPDRVIPEAAGLVPTGPLVIHLSGVTTLAPLLAHHERCGSLHPLVSLPDPQTGAAVLTGGAHVAVAGADGEIERWLTSLARDIGARPFAVADHDRALYHGAACVASNHLVALTAQVERLVADADLPIEPFLAMMRAVLDNVGNVGSAAALTGPVARADWPTVQAHLDAIGPSEASLYAALAKACADLASTTPPADLFPDPEETS